MQEKEHNVHTYLLLLCTSVELATVCGHQGSSIKTSQNEDNIVNICTEKAVLLYCVMCNLQIFQNLK